MKKIRLLQGAVFIVFAALILQVAAVDIYKGFMEGVSDGIENKANPEITTSLIPSAVIDARLINAGKDGTRQLNNNYRLENISINADIRVNDKLVKTPWWLTLFQVIIDVVIFILLVRLCYMVYIIIFNIYINAIFNKRSVSLVRQTGVLLIIYPVADYLSQQETYLKSKSLLNAPITVINASEFNFVLLLCGLLVLILAEAFKQGAKLKEEQEFTI
jgi:hypothetical protein